MRKAFSMEGPLSKWTNVMNGWQYRWFVLEINNGALCYYTSKEKMVKGERRGVVKLRGAQVGIDNLDDSTFTITVDHKTFHFQARDVYERQIWLDALQEARDLHTQSYPLIANTNRHLFGSTIETNFDRRLFEAEVYLRVLIDQQNTLVSKVNNTDVALPKSSEEILDKLGKIVTNIEKAIVCLQYAKENAGNVLSSARSSQCLHDEMFTESNVNISVTRSVDCSSSANNNNNINNGKKKKKGKSIKNKSHLLDEDKAVEKLKHTKSLTNVLMAVEMSESYIREMNDSMQILSSRPETANDMTFMRRSDNEFLTKKYLKHDKVSIDEITSYDSDDEYFDPVDERSSNSFDMEIASRSNSFKTPANNKIVSPQNSTHLTPHNNNNSQVPFDDLYDDTEESDLGNLSSHGSIITHLISQVRIGMDLTKITLPTFILERRSGLEMYADFLAHADLWVEIGRGDTPYSRFFAALRWYLSAFHAGRKSDIAKKPYNPILGEIFRCYWQVPLKTDTAESEVGEKEKTVTRDENHPVSWAPDDAVIFLAEQVSHHPPVSAFYAEYPLLHMTLQGTLYTKSKFLGVSVAVDMIGDTEINLLDHDEKYVLNFPSGYGRNIFNVPWIELAGKCRLNCDKTGYQATIEFKAKPFFSSQKNLVYVEAFGPNDKKPIFTIEGEWNREMVVKHANGKSEVFFDVAKYPLVPKSVRPRSEQSSNESRKLWEDVTYFLGKNDITLATNSKATLEDKQRREAKQRREENIDWNSKYFEKVGDAIWSYKNPLKIQNS